MENLSRTPQSSPLLVNSTERLRIFANLVGLWQRYPLRMMKHHICVNMKDLNVCLKSPIYWGILGHNCKFCSYPASERWMDTEEKSELKDWKIFKVQKYLLLLVRPLNNQDESKCGGVKYSEIENVWKSFILKCLIWIWRILVSIDMSETVLNQGDCNWCEPGWDCSESPTQIKIGQWVGDGYPDSLE